MTARALQAGDRIRVGSGYDYKVEWMAAARGAFGFPGTVVEFIPGQNQQRAAVIELDEELVLPHGAGEGRGRELRGKFLVLELGHVGTDWATPRPRIHVELCEFHPNSSLAGSAARNMGRVARDVRLPRRRAAIGAC
jgi:hypothetical protein